MKFLTIFKAAKLLNLTRQRLWQKCKAGHFKIYRCDCDNSYLLDEEEVKNSNYHRHDRYEKTKKDTPDTQ